MKILITGAAGFIGSHLVRYHLNKGDEVWGVDSLVKGSEENITPWLKNSSFRFDAANIITWDKLPQALDWSERVYHMAALLGLKYVFGHPFEVVSENIHSCERLLFLASKKQGPLQLLITSSSCVYGSYSSSVDDTEDTPLTLYPQKYLQQTYATSKITNEVMSLCYSSYAHMHTVIARLFNVIGPNQTGRYGMVVPTFISQALKNEPITIYGSGKQTRSFCSVHDITEGLDTLLSATSSKNQIYNIGSTEEISILDLAHKIKEKTKSHSPIVFIPYQEAYGFDYEEIQRRQPNINKVKQHIGFAPKVSLDRAIDEIIASQQLRLKDLA